MTMKTKDFDGLMAGLNEALAYVQGNPSPGTRVHLVEVNHSFVARTRLNAGLTQEEFAQATGASLGTVRKWESGERQPSGAAGMLIRIMAKRPKLVIEEAGLKRVAGHKRRTIQSSLG